MGEGGAPAGDAPILVCGLGHFGYRAVDLLLRLGRPVVVLTQKAREEWRHEVEERGAVVVLGDARDARTLQQAGLARATAVLALTDGDLVNIEIALDVRRNRPGVPIVVRLFDQTLARQIEQSFDVRRAVAVSTLAAPAFAGAALGERTLGALELSGKGFVVAKHTLDPASPLAGIPLREMAWRHRLEVVAHREASEAGAGLPDPDRPGAPGDQLFVLAERGDWTRFAHAAGRLEPRRLHPRSRWREGLAGATQAWRGSPRALRTIFLTLVSLMAVSVAVFSRALHLSIADSLYFVVETVTTTGYGDISPMSAPLAVKLYACFVMLLGSAALATFTSIVTAYAVAERFRGRRVPREDHVIVVGIGNVGLRTLEELVREKVPVVAVDRDGASEFLPGVRAISPVVLGDARSEAVLREAGIADARALIAVTDDDAANLGIALAARRLNPHARTVVRLFDGDFARKVESALDVDVAIGSAPIAAPLFVASALVPDVRAAFLAGNALVAIVEERLEGTGDESPDRLRAKGLHVLRAKDAGGSWVEAPRGEPLAEGSEILAARVFPLSAS